LIAGTLPIPAGAYQKFLDRYRQQAAGAEWIIAAGSLPPGVPEYCYRTVAEIAHEIGTPILLDGVGPPILAALPARPTILKMNRAEFSATFDVQADTIDQMQTQAKIIYEREKLSALVITLGKQGILAVTGDGAFLAAAPLQQAVNAAGAGDAASATLVWRLAAGDSWPEVLRQTAAVSAAAVLTEATAEVRLADVERLLPKTAVQKL
jgi:fructose-1-phosphate kinase PfkB-like protein